MDSQNHLVENYLKERPTSGSLGEAYQLDLWITYLSLNKETERKMIRYMLNGSSEGNLNGNSATKKLKIVNSSGNFGPVPLNPHYSSSYIIDTHIENANVLADFDGGMTGLVTGIQ